MGKDCLTNLQRGHGRLTLSTSTSPEPPLRAGITQWHCQAEESTVSRGSEPTPTQVARNFPRSVFESPRNRCNSNDMNSNVEIVRRELRATLLGNHSWSLAESAWQIPTTTTIPRQKAENSPRHHVAPSQPDTQPRPRRRKRPPL